MKTLALLATFLLSSCAAIFGPDDWEPSGHMTVPGMVGANGGTMGPINLYRPNPNEKPRVVKVAVAEGKTIDVQVFANRCIGGDNDGTAYSLGGTVYLCNRPKTEKHELAHSAGMRHGVWMQGGGAKCAKVTHAGYNTGYTVGTMVCRSDNDHEWVEK